MSEAREPQKRNALVNVLVRMEEPPWDAAYRVVIGLMVLPVLASILGNDASVWALAPWFLGVLLALRFVPMISRKCLPFPNFAHAIWSERRQLAKRYDSYQWKKLVWIGTGLAMYTVLPGHVQPARMILASVCLVSGTVGLVTWRFRRTQFEAREGTVVPAGARL